MYNKARVRWTRGSHRGSTRLVDLFGGYVEVSEAIGFTMTILYAQAPKRGFVKKALGIVVCDGSDAEIGHIRLDIASIYSKMRKLRLTQLDRKYEMATAAGNATLELAFTITDLDHAVPLSIAPSALGSVCVLSSYAGSDAGAEPGSASFDSGETKTARDRADSGGLPPRYGRELPPLPSDQRRNTHRSKLSSGVVGNQKEPTDPEIVGKSVDSAMKTLETLTIPASPKFGLPDMEAITPEELDCDGGIELRNETINDLKRQLAEKVASQRVQLFDRLIMLADPTYTPKGTPVLALAVHACMKQWDGYRADPGKLASALELLSSRLWAARSSMPTVLHVASAVVFLHSLRQRGPSVLSCTRPAPDDSVESRLGALVHEAVWFAHCNIAHDFKGVVPALLDFALTEPPLVKSGLQRLMDQIGADCDKFHLPKELRAVLFRQFFRHIASLLFNQIIDPASGLCTVSTGLRMQSLIGDLQPSLGDAAGEVEPLKQLADVLLMNKRKLLDPAVRERVCPALNLLQIDQVVSSFRPDSMGPEPVDPRLKNEVNLLVARHFVELERLDVELDTMDLPSFEIECDFDTEDSISKDLVPGEIASCALFDFLFV
ncbi:DIL domain [Carpediemonas membranifera]|uniref:DIL domain n=1 Tax=Carpediemonas membranifera TaxID=201153 RepID=A0A8J6AWH9_9EUKA|nr:DIL domain [Carpediemonas membranifera]|eukprot:KAG9395923.1 DIL domain [Carpediemonas membranifera]